MTNEELKLNKQVHELLGRVHVCNRDKRSTSFSYVCSICFRQFPLPIPDYANDLNAAWQCVEYIKENDISGFPFVLCEDRYGGCYSGGKWIASFTADPSGCLFDDMYSDDVTCSSFWCDDVKYFRAADNPAKAICMAFVEAMGKVRDGD